MLENCLKHMSKMLIKLSIFNQMNYFLFDTKSKNNVKHYWLQSFSILRLLLNFFISLLVNFLVNLCIIINWESL